MILLINDWNLLDWVEWLEQELGLLIGQDYKWSWHNGCWAIELERPENELMIVLKSNPGQLVQIEIYNDSAID